MDGMGVFNPKRPVQLQGKQHALDEASIPDDKFDLIQEILKLLQPHESVTQVGHELRPAAPWFPHFLLTGVAHAVRRL